MKAICVSQNINSFPEASLGQGRPWTLYQAMTTFTSGCHAPCTVHTAHFLQVTKQIHLKTKLIVHSILGRWIADCVRTESCNFQEGRLKRLALNGDFTKECMWFKHNYATNSNLNLPCSFLSRSIHNTEQYFIIAGCHLYHPRLQRCVLNQLQL